VGRRKDEGVGAPERRARAVGRSQYVHAGLDERQVLYGGGYAAGVPDSWHADRVDTWYERTRARRSDPRHRNDAGRSQEVRGQLEGQMDSGAGAAGRPRVLEPSGVTADRGRTGADGARDEPGSGIRSRQSQRAGAGLPVGAAPLHRGRTRSTATTGSRAKGPRACSRRRLADTASTRSGAAIAPRIHPPASRASPSRPNSTAASRAW
jgi:hypothetical protein